MCKGENDSEGKLESNGIKGRKKNNLFQWPGVNESANYNWQLCDYLRGLWDL